MSYFHIPYLLPSHPFHFHTHIHFHFHFYSCLFLSSLNRCLLLIFSFFILYSLSLSFSLYLIFSFFILYSLSLSFSLYLIFLWLKTFILINISSFSNLFFSSSSPYPYPSFSFYYISQIILSHLYCNSLNQSIRKYY